MIFSWTRVVVMYGALIPSSPQDVKNSLSPAGEMTEARGVPWIPDQVRNDILCLTRHR